MRARFADLREINLRDEGFRLIDRSVGNDFAGRRADKALPPKFNAVTTCGLFMTHAVDGCEKTAVGHGVATLDGLPCIVLMFAFGSLLTWMPTNGGGIKQNLSPGQGGEARRLREPLIPANQHANSAESRVPRAKAQIARRKVKFFIIQGIFRDVHFPVNTEQRSVGINNGGGIMVQADRAFLEQRRDDHDLFLASNLLESLRAGARNGLGEVEICVVFTLRKVLVCKEFLCANDLRATAGRLGHSLTGVGEIRGRIGFAGLLQEPQFNLLRRVFHLLFSVSDGVLKACQVKLVVEKQG